MWNHEFCKLIKNSKLNSIGGYFIYKFYNIIAYMFYVYTDPQKS